MSFIMKAYIWCEVHSTITNTIFYNVFIVKWRENNNILMEKEFAFLFLLLFYFVIAMHRSNFAARLAANDVYSERRYDAVIWHKHLNGFVLWAIIFTKWKDVISVDFYEKLNNVKRMSHYSNFTFTSFIFPH